MNKYKNRGLGYLNKHHKVLNLVFMKNLHCCIDDKFIDGAITLFEEDKQADNKYVIFTPQKKDKYQYVKNEKVINLQTDSFLNYIETEKFDIIYLHSLFCINLSLIQQIPTKYKVVWLSWGFDTYSYSYPLIKTELYEPITKEFINKTLHSKLRSLKESISYKIFHKSDHINALKRIDYYSGVFPYEYYLIKQSFSDFKAIPIDFYYGSKDFFIKESICKDYKEDQMKHLIIGNSAADTNNHLDVLYKLKDLTQKNWEKCIIPLSYCGTNTYKNEIEEKGKKIFGDKLLSLRTYLPINEYLNLISKCKTAIYLHNRQQASDNIFMQMNFGARVFMSSKNEMFKYLKSQGLKIYSFQDDFDLINEPMNYEDVMVNREYLSANYSSTKLIQRIIDINKKVALSL